MKNNIGVIFDCDGTLLDSMGVWHALDDRLASLVGIDLEQKDRDYMTAATLLESSIYLHENFGIGQTAQDVVDIIHDDMLSYYQHEAKLKPGVREFVEGLATMGIPMGVASSTSPLLLKTGLEVVGLAPYMEVILSVEDLNTSKREPLIFDTVRAKVGTSLENTWLFDDAVYAINTAKAAGYSAVGVYDSEIAGSPDELREAADYSIMSFEELTPEQFVRLAQNGRDRLEA